ncbi:MAG: class I SAM-dependent methyltransferase [Planctomycetes bacterium]|nr:class I SAM-dependent methyltransferase [Planctomycetota bacterium]
MPRIDFGKVVSDLLRPRAAKRPEGYKEAAARLLFARQIAAYHWVLPHLAGKRVLEVGANRGYGLKIFKPHASLLVGAELSERLARIAHAETDVPVVRANGEHLPFADQSFDVIVSFQVIEHVWDTHAFVAEIARILAPGGVFIVTTPYRPGRLLEGEVPRFDEHVREYDSTEYRALMDTAFEQVEVIGLYAEDQSFDLERMRNWRRAEEYYFQGLATAPLRLMFRLLRGLRRRPRVDPDYVKQAVRENLEQLAGRFQFGKEHMERWDHLAAVCRNPKSSIRSPNEVPWQPGNLEQLREQVRRRARRLGSPELKAVEPAASLGNVADADAIEAVARAASILKPGEHLAFLDGPFEVRDAGIRVRGYNFWRHALPLAGLEAAGWLPGYGSDFPDPAGGVSGGAAPRMPWLTRLGIIVARRTDSSAGQARSQTIDEVRSQEHIHERRARELLPGAEDAFMH